MESEALLKLYIEAYAKENDLRLNSINQVEAYNNLQILSGSILGGILGGGTHGTSGNVECKMPNNLHKVSLNSAKKCNVCGEYFCKTHSISKCPISSCSGDLR